MAGPNVKTVAQAAGVSTATVSNAYNRPERLSAEVRARIFAVAREQGYAGPDAAARSLRTGRAGAIGAIFTVPLSSAFADPYMVDMLGGLTEVAEPARTGLLLIPFSPIVTGAGADQVREAVRAVHRAVIDGAVADGLGDDHPAVQALTSRGIPLVRSSDTGTGRCVIIDDRAVGNSIGRHLAALGHRDVAVVVAGTGRPGVVRWRPDEARLYPYSALRLAGIREALGPAARVTVLSGGPNAAASGRAAAAAVLGGADRATAGGVDRAAARGADRATASGAPRPTAIAADSDVLATGVLAEVRRMGLQPGRDVSVTGCDDVPAAAAAGLTSVRQPIREKGRLMGRMLLDPEYTERRVVLPTELVVRATTGPARTG